MTLLWALHSTTSAESIHGLPDLFPFTTTRSRVLYCLCNKYTPVLDRYSELVVKQIRAVVKVETVRNHIMRIVLLLLVNL